MSTVEQLIRIAAYTGGAFFLGQGVADGAEFQAAVGGLGALASFGWWLYSNRKAKKAGR